MNDPFASDTVAALAEAPGDDDFAALMQRPGVAVPAAAAGASIARLHGFDLQDAPLLADVPGAPGEIVTARSSVALRQEMRGCEVVVVFEGGDPRRPIVLGALRNAPAAARPAPVLDAQLDGERLVLSAEHEVVLQCGDASITLTRAGKVLIRGNYILSRSTGYNKIKGAAVDIN